MQKVPLVPPPAEIHLFTDASTMGWGAHVQLERNHEWSGRWNSFERSLHINILELKTVVLSLQRGLQLFRGKSLLVASDNMSVVAYLNHQGGTRSRSLNQMTTDLLKWTRQNRIHLRARHIPGHLNVLADMLSRRGQILPTEWSLHQSTFDALCREVGRPTVDLFATSRNHKLPTYVSPVQDEAALAVDALSMDWTGMHGYAYPPTPIIRKVLQKIRETRCRILLIAPYWPSQSWFTDLSDMCESKGEKPIRLHVSEKMLKQPLSNVFHSDPETLHLHAWKLSSEGL